MAINCNWPWAVSIDCALNIFIEKVLYKVLMVINHNWNQNGNTAETIVVTKTETKAITKTKTKTEISLLNYN